MRHTEIRFLAFAIALHAAIPLIAQFVDGNAFAPSATPVTSIAEIEIDTRDIQLPQVEAPQKPAAFEPQTTRERDVPPVPEENRRTIREPANNNDDPYATTAPENPNPAPEGTGAPQPSPSDQYDPLPEGDGSVLTGPPGIGRSVWTMPGVLPDMPRARPANTAAPAPRPVDRDVAGKVLRGELKSRDKQIGIDLPAAGTVASAVGAAVRAIETPNEGRASFAVRLSASGKVLEVKLLTASAGSRDVWERAAKAAAAQLAGRSLSMTGEFASGAMVYVNVSSDVVLPSGTKGGVKTTGLSGEFDLSDIGTHTVRRVSTSFTVVPIKSGG